MLIEYLGSLPPVASQRKTGSCPKAKSHKHALADGDHKMGVSRTIEDVFQENTIFQLHYSPLFESTHLWLMLPSDKGCGSLLVLPENPNQDLPWLINFLGTTLCLPNR